MIATRTVSDIVFDEMQDFVKELCGGNAKWFWAGLDSDIENAAGKHYRPLDENGDATDYAPRSRSEWIRVGCTGFDLIKRFARYATFEFDVGHSDNAITENQREEIIAKLGPYCELVNSTGANGIHGRIWFDSPISCESRKEYSQLCEAAIKVLEQESRFAFAHLVESKGCILWLASVNQVDFENGSDRTSFEQLSETNATIASEDVLASVDQSNSASNDNRVEHPDADDCLGAMLRIKAKDSENDGSKRLFAVCCRAVEYDLSDDRSIQNVRLYEQQQQFPGIWTDAEILARIRSAEQKVVRGSAKPTIAMPMDFAPLLTTMESVLSKQSVFQRAGSLVHIVPGANGPKIEDIHPDALIVKLTAAVDFRGRNSKGNDIELLPSKQAQKAMHSLGKYEHIRQINGVVNHPLVLPSGSIVTETGFNDESGFYVQIDRSYPQLMATSDAVELLEDLLHDFPFSSPADKSAVLAYFLTLACRNCIPGPTPVFVFDGNRAGVGKGLLASLGVMIVSGRQAANYPGCSDDDELRKLLISVARSGERYIVFDNVKGNFGGPSLESAATTGLISGRILGRSKDVTYPLNLTMAVTANGYMPTEDMVRRSIAVTLDSSCPAPHLRDGFRHADLLAHTSQHHPLLMMAVLSIISNHLKAGCPSHGSKPIGSFGGWDATVRAAIINAGLPDPCCSLIERSSEVSEIPSDLVALARSWNFEGPVSVKDVVHSTETKPELHAGLGDVLKKKPETQTPARHLGNLLRQAIGHVIDGHEFVKSGNKTKKWELKTT